MQCECCQGLSLQLSQGDRLHWLDYAVRIVTVPDGLDSAAQNVYHLLLDSGLAWKVDHIDAWGQLWLRLQRVNDQADELYEAIRLEPGSFQRVPHDPVYPVIQYAAGRTC
ncbi:hypothetical protein [Pseudomonas sp. nanlin1]|uniref:hypothetical protein n=1 Tax=Pseudomonas sp. nanlin1 TaxID=3040605 RepID=UPI00389035ED